MKVLFAWVAVGICLVCLLVVMAWLDQQSEIDLVDSIGLECPISGGCK